MIPVSKELAAYLFCCFVSYLFGSSSKRLKRVQGWVVSKWATHNVVQAALRIVGDYSRSAIE